MCKRKGGLCPVQVVRSRLAIAHGEEEWIDYFFPQYFQQCGEVEDLAACWFCGMGSSLHEGHTPSQQVAEEFNSMAKSDLRRVDPNLSTHTSLCVALERCVETWVQALPASEHNVDGPKYTLNAADSHIAMSRPCRPPPEMLHGKSFTACPPGQKQQYFPTVPQLLELMKKKNTRYIQLLQRGEQVFLVMATNRPQASWV